jgi:hypothetical protein
MKKLVLLFILGLFISTFSLAQDKGTPYLVKTYKSSEVKNLNVSTSGGGISIMGGAGDEARIEVYLKVNNGGSKLSKDDVENRLKEYKLSIKKEGETILCIAKRKSESSWNNRKNELSISFKIYTPEKISINLITSGGGISLKNLTGNLDFSTSSGGLKLQNLGGNVKGRTSGGGINISSCRGMIDVATSGGGIYAEGCKGDVKLTTAGGSLTLKKLDGTIKATTSGGGIRAEEISGDFETSTSGGSIKLKNITANVKASTSGGGIDADIKSLGKYLSLSTSAGSIHIRMPMDKGIDLDLYGQNVKVPTLSKFSGTVEKNRVKGSLNGGGITVKMEANSGGVYINE